MKRILFINTTFSGSTGKICNYLFEREEKNLETFFAVGRSKDSLPKNCFQYCGFGLANTYSQITTKISGGDGFHNHLSTSYLIREIRKIHPDLIHIHNLHGYTTNIPTLFKFLRTLEIPIVITLHDCWLITGRCAHFAFNRCEKWMTGCNKCNFKNEYPRTVLFDKANSFWKIKKEIFDSNRRIVFVTPSFWLSDIVKTSYLKNHRIEVINNGIENPKLDLAQTVVKKDDRKVIVAAASIWSKTKGIDDVLALSQMLNPSLHRLIVVGRVFGIRADKYKNIEFVGPIDNLELMKTIRSADLFINTTYQDTFPTVNIEALILGVPIVSYATGGCVETINENVGRLVKQGDLEELFKSIITVINGKSLKENCVMEGKKYTAEIMVDKYYNLYEELLGNGKNNAH